MQSRTFKKFPRDFTYRFDDVIFESTRITTCVNENYERKVRRLPRKMQRNVKKIEIVVEFVLETVKKKFKNFQENCCENI